MENKRGIFIVIEGIDGAGKSTQAELLCDFLRSLGREVHLTAEPTRFPSGMAIRDALKGKVKKTESEMAAMFVLDRIAHNIDEGEGIEVLLSRGIDVICDRYYYSSLAYQGHATDYDWVKRINLDCPDIRRPDLCIYLDLTPEESLERIARGRESVEIYENIETLTSVRRAFHRVFDDLEGRDNIRIINAYRTVDEISSELCAEVQMLLK